LGLEGRALEVDADDALAAEALRPLLDEDALAAADVEQRLRGGLREQLVQRALEGGHQPAHDRVGRAVLVVRVAGDRAFAIDGDGRAAHTSRASLSSVWELSPGSRLPACAPVVAGWPVSWAPGS